MVSKFWTTTPWTIPSNQMAAVGENIEYNIVKVNERKFILASTLVNKVAEQIGWTTFEILDTLKGTELGLSMLTLWENKN